MAKQGHAGSLFELLRSFGWRRRKRCCGWSQSAKANSTESQCKIGPHSTPAPGESAAVKVEKLKGRQGKEKNGGSSAATNLTSSSDNESVDSEAELIKANTLDGSKNTQNNSKLTRLHSKLNKQQRLQKRIFRQHHRKKYCSGSQSAKANSTESQCKIGPHSVPIPRESAAVKVEKLKGRQGKEKNGGSTAATNLTSSSDNESVDSETELMQANTLNGSKNEQNESKLTRLHSKLNKQQRSEVQVDITLDKNREPFRSKISISASDDEDDCYTTAVQQTLEDEDDTNDEEYSAVEASGAFAETFKKKQELNPVAEAAECETPCIDEEKMLNQTRETSDIEGETRVARDEHQLMQQEVKPILNGSHIVGLPYAHQFIQDSSLDLQVYQIARKRIDSVKKIGPHRSLKVRMLTFESYVCEHLQGIQCAKAGFINHKNVDAIMCVWCRLELKDFRQPVDVFALHQLHSSSCDYLKAVALQPLDQFSKLFEIYDIAIEQPVVPANSAESEGLLTTTSTPAILQDDSSETSDLSGMDEISKYELLLKPRQLLEQSIVKSVEFALKGAQKNNFEEHRLKTFDACSHLSKEAARALATNGILWTGHHLACGFCDWELTVKVSDDQVSEKDIISKHYIRPLGSNCRFNTGKNIPMLLEESCWQKDLTSLSVSTSDYENLGAIGVAVEMSKYPEFAVADRRQATFTTYPYGNCKSSEELVEAGYFYTGKNDVVICFSCGVESGNWTVEEAPWQRHARSSKRCQYLLRLKGAYFVSQIIEQFQEYIPPPQENKINTVTTRMLRPRMESPAVQGCLSRGLDRNKVRNAVIRRIQKGEPDFNTIADVVRAVYELEVPEIAQEPNIILPAHEQPTATEITNDIEVSSDEAMQGAVGGEPAEVEPEDTVDGTIEQMQTDTPQTDSRRAPQTDAVNLPNPTEIPREDPLAALLQPDGFKTVSSQLTCKICLSSVVGIIFLPCGHLVCCIACAAAMVQCPLCRRDIKGTVKADFTHL